MKNSVTFAFAAISLFSTIVFAEQPPLERWVARYNGPAGGIDQTLALAIDGSGNVYVTGQSWGASTNYDYATVKYNFAGNQLWAARYNGDANNSDKAYALAVDNSGNIYVTGQSWNGTDWDYATIKYGSGGNQLWAMRYSSPGQYNDCASALAVDGSGNIYVTGSSGGSDVTYNYTTVKYDANGIQKWVAYYNGPQSYDQASAIAVDNSGNVYVTGQSYGSGTGCDYATIKYGPNGNKLWEARYTGPGGDYDSATALAVDDSGNVYVTGSSYGGGSRYDYATIKYNSNGGQVWAKRYNGTANQTDEAYALALDNLGNIYVTGKSAGSGTSDDYATIKYDSNSTQLWVSRYNALGNGDDGAQAIAVDNFGNVYVTGQSYGNGTNTDYATVKIDPYGNQSWIAYYNGPANGGDAANRLVIDNSGNIYVAGVSYGNSDDFAAIKYTQHDYCTTALTGDLDNNCKVDFIDYAALAKNWLNGTDWNDIAVLAGNWLECNFALTEDCW